MQSMVEQIKIIARDDKNAEIRLIPRPLFRYNSPSRTYDDGTIWGWGKGRPLAMMELWTGNSKEPSWIHGMVLTSTELVEAYRGERREWQPLAADIKFHSIPNAERPAESKLVRLREMKQFARAFTAHQFWKPNNSRFELRLLVQPVHRYQDEKSGIIDGAVFLMAHEIEPEVIILIEAVKNNDELTWQYAVTPIGAAEFHIQLSGEEIYRRNRDYGGRTKTWTLFKRYAERD
jgi:hypothetical protein